MVVCQHDVPDRAEIGVGRCQRGLDEVDVVRPGQGVDQDNVSIPTDHEGMDIECHRARAQHIRREVDVGAGREELGDWWVMRRQYALHDARQSGQPEFVRLLRNSGGCGDR